MNRRSNLDPKVIRHLRILHESGEEQAERMVETWIVECALDLDRLQNAIDRRDARSIAKLARASKRSAENLGAMGCASALRKILGMLRAPCSAADLAPVLHDCWEAFDNTSAILRALLEQGGVATEPGTPL